MEFLPVEVEEVKSIFSIAKSAVDVITRLCHLFKELDEDEAGENADRKDCIKEAILSLTQETEAKKSPHLEKFVENTLLNPECRMESSTIFYFLKDIEQMTWRQFCLLEGFSRNDNSNFQISPRGDSDINGISIGIEIEKLINLNYLRSESNDPADWRPIPIRFDVIYITQLGREILRLLELHSVETEEIGPAFGKGKITETKQNTY